MTAAYTIKQNDTKPMVAVLRDATGPINLTGATVRFLAVQAAPGTKTITRAGVVTDPTAGEVEVPWASDDLDTPGNYRAEFEITFAPTTPSEKKQTVPNDEWWDFRVLAELG